MTRLGALALLACGLAAGRTPHAGDPVSVTRHYTREDQQAKRYVYVPFTVPPGTTHLKIGYRYDKGGGANTVDLGLYEPGPLTLGTKAFRGYSGGAQERVTLGVDGASPGYWPGPLPPGEWHVLLGLYQVGAQGVDVTVTVEMDASAATGPTPAILARNAGPLRRGAAWYAGAMHTHTTHSDGALTPEALVDKARGEHLDFVVLTDHNNTTHQLTPVDRPDLLVITGEEATTPGGHFNVWGLHGARTYVDFRIQPGDPAIGTVMQQAADGGALVSINHPMTDCFACTWTHAVPPAVSAIEIFNGTPVGRQQALGMWDVLLRSGRRLTAVGESDWHRGTAPIGAPVSRVWAEELSTRAIFDAIRAHHVVVMANATLPAPEVAALAGTARARVGDDLKVQAGELVQVQVDLDAAAYQGARVSLVSSGEAVATTAVPADGHVRFDRWPTASGYLRIHVLAPDGSPLAITNPIFLTVR